MLTHTCASVQARNRVACGRAKMCTHVRARIHVRACLTSSCLHTDACIHENIGACVHTHAHAGAHTHTHAQAQEWVHTLTPPPKARSVATVMMSGNEALLHIRYHNISVITYNDIMTRLSPKTRSVATVMMSGDDTCRSTTSLNPQPKPPSAPAASVVPTY